MIGNTSFARLESRRAYEHFSRTGDMNQHELADRA
jgi:hypothetical protein